MGRAKDERERHSRHGRRVKVDWVARVKNAVVGGDCEVIVGVKESDEREREGDRPREEKLS
ncbi:hypothetical protein SCA6_014476 [Theobroma cacao]